MEFLALPPEGAAEYFRSQPNPRQVMSPNSSQALPQDPFHMQVPNPEADDNVRTNNSPVKCKEEESSPAYMPAKEEAYVKEEPESESEGSRNGTPAQASRPSVAWRMGGLVSRSGPMNRRFLCQTETVKKFLQVPWNDAMTTENVVHEPTFMAYELRLLWRTNPPFMPYEPFLLGVGVVFNLLRMVGDKPRSAPPRRGTQRTRAPTAEVERWIN